MFTIGYTSLRGVFISDANVKPGERLIGIGMFANVIPTRLVIQGSYLFSETNFQDFSRTQIDFSRAPKFTLTPILPRPQW